MILTNKHNLSLPLVMFLAHDDYDGGSTNKKYISVTNLMKPARSIIIAKQNSDLTKEVDLHDLVAMKMGSALHAWMETAWKNPATISKACAILNISEKTFHTLNIKVEQRTNKKMSGWTISGKYDAVIDGRIYDLKSCSVWSQIYDSNKADYILQGSLYRWLNPNDIKDDVIEINKIFTDWSASAARAKRDYPQLRVMSKHYPLMSIEKTSEWVKNKLSQIDAYLGAKNQESIPYCTAEELWASPTKYKVFKKEESKRAMSGGVKETMTEAQQFQVQKGGVIKIFPGEVKRCTYCSVCEICNQAKELQAKGLLTL